MPLSCLESPGQPWTCSGAVSASLPLGLVPCAARLGGTSGGVGKVTVQPAGRLLPCGQKGRESGCVRVKASPNNVPQCNARHLAAQWQTPQDPRKGDGAKMSQHAPMTWGAEPLFAQGFQGFKAETPGSTPSPMPAVVLFPRVLCSCNELRNTLGGAPNHARSKAAPRGPETLPGAVAQPPTAGASGAFATSAPSNRSLTFPNALLKLLPFSEF